tara:strand:- start:67284 stop:70355 length:3072 start_codon:yes stop_codon:yes gene_type:complete
MIFSGLNEAVISNHEIKDIEGYVSALLDDIENDLSYDDWIKLVAILKREIEDEELAFDLFDTFSSRFDSYDPNASQKKFFESQIEAGDVGIGSLVHWVKEDLGDEYQPQKYLKFFSEEKVSPLQLAKKRKESKKTVLPNHTPLCDHTTMELPAPIDAELFRQVILDKPYATSRDPWNHTYANLYNGDIVEQYISVNPLDQSTGSRNQDSVADYKYCVLEFDDIPLEEQAGVLMMADLPCEAIVFTGNKSIHSWIRIDAENNTEYKERTRLLAKLVKDFGFNPDTKVLYDSCSLVRCPGVERYNFDPKKGAVGPTGLMQELLWAGNSVGWQTWYRTVYPSLLEDKTVLLETPEGVEEVGYPTKKSHNYTRLKKAVVEMLPGIVDEFETALEDAEDKTVALSAMIEILMDSVTSKSKRIKLSDVDLFFLLKDPVEAVPMDTEVDKLEVLYGICRETFERHSEKEMDKKKKRLDQYQEYLTELESDDLKDTELINRIISAFDQAKHDDTKLEELIISFDRVMNDAGVRPLVLVQSEIHKMADTAAVAVSDQVPELYRYAGNLSIIDRGGLKPIDSDIFPSIVGPGVAFIRYIQGKFMVQDMPDSLTKKLMKSPDFNVRIPEINLVSDVPVFFVGEEGCRIITGYDKEAKTLVTCNDKGYELMELEDAKEIILNLFSDFKFVSPSDLSRAISGLMLPGLAYAGLLEGGSRPLIYTTADAPGAGKGTITKFMSIPYTKSWSIITAEACKGGLDEAIFTKLAEGESIIIIDNLKKSKAMKEFSSSTIEGMITSDNITGRAAFSPPSTFDVSKTILHANTNGIEMSSDLVDRSLTVAIRKTDKVIKKYQGGLDNWIAQSSPKILSAVYTVLAEYVSLGCPKKTCLEPQRFEDVAAILNAICVDILDLPDISINSTRRKKQMADSSNEIARAVCFAAAAEGKLGEGMRTLDIYECLVANNTDNCLGVFLNFDDYQDESGLELTQDAKKKISVKIGKALSKSMKDNKIYVEEFCVEKVRDSKGFKYVITEEQ